MKRFPLASGSPVQGAFHDPEGFYPQFGGKSFAIMGGSLECVNDVIRVMDEVVPVGAFMMMDSSGRIAPETVHDHGRVLGRLEGAAGRELWLIAGGMAGTSEVVSTSGRRGGVLRGRKAGGRRVDAERGRRGG